MRKQGEYTLTPEWKKSSNKSIIEEKKKSIPIYCFSNYVYTQFLAQLSLFLTSLVICWLLLLLMLTSMMCLRIFFALIQDFSISRGIPESLIRMGFTPHYLTFCSSVVIATIVLASLCQPFWFYILYTYVSFVFWCFLLSAQHITL